jgi:hypothetical protein
MECGLEAPRITPHQDDGGTLARKHRGRLQAEASGGAGNDGSDA